MTDDGFPHSGYPSGWFQVAWAAELAPGDVRPIHYFGRELVLYRTNSGSYHVIDAYCPHMGAHLGHGGCVESDNLVCPFHGWSWGPDGRNVMVPSIGERTDRRRLTTWTSTVANGIVYVWFDEKGRGPLWDGPTDLPGVAEGRRHDVFPNCSRVWRNARMRPQYVPENNIDLDHLRWIHRAEGPLELLEFGEDGYFFRVKNRIIYGYGKESTRLTPHGPIEVDVEAELWGLGFQYTFFRVPDDAVSIQAQTPVDEIHCDMFQTVVVYCSEGCAPGDQPTGMAAARVREQLVQIERDIPIWENMKYLRNAALTRTEAKPMVALRRWAERFYAADSRLAAASSSHGGDATS
jgi:3-ketosteroid 9alpha-monooxygenase subunit A